ncbi:MAG TPA: STAS domain-containing protein [Terriglobales bacterium]|nr:STAS domain-containing protein [Terriglobales bacterium]
MRLTLSTRMAGDVTVVDCVGDIVYRDEAALLRSDVKKLLEEGRKVVLNLAEVRMVDSNGVGTLVGLLTSSRGHGELRLAALGKKMQDVLKITKLTALFAIEETVEQAVEKFQRENTPVAVGELPH